MDIYKNDLFRKEIDRLHMNVSEVIYSELSPDWHYGNKRPSFTRIYAIMEGEGVITYSDKEIPMRAGNLYILPTGTSFKYRCLTEIKKIYFHVNLLQYNGYDIFNSMKQVAVIENIPQEISKAYEYFKRSDTYGVMHLKAWLFDKVVESFEITSTDLGTIAEYSPLVKQIIQYIEAHLRSALTVSEIAADLYVSESRLQKAFRSEVGSPLGKYITDRLFFAAEQQLRTTERSIKEISEELGFCDPFYFSRRFSSRYGVSPSIYRKHSKKA